MIYVLIVIAVLLLFLVLALRSIAKNFAFWATQDIKYKNEILYRKP
jgi:hypothetical protein